MLHYPTYALRSIVNCNYFWKLQTCKFMINMYDIYYGHCFFASFFASLTSHSSCGGSSIGSCSVLSSSSSNICARARGSSSSNAVIVFFFCDSGIFCHRHRHCHRYRYRYRHRLWQRLYLPSLETSSSARYYFESAAKYNIGRVNNMQSAV